MKDDRASLIKELASAASVQTEVSNRSWIALISVSVIAVLPRAQATEFSLPLGLGAVSATWFHFVMFCLLIVLAIAFAAAHAQQVRAQRLANYALKQLGDQPLAELHVHPRDFFDVLRVPSVNRIAPIAQLFQGLDAFYSSEKRPPIWRSRASVAYYLLLKCASWLVYFGFPLLALWLSFSRVPWPDWRRWVLLGGGSIATLPVVHVFLVDIAYVIHVSRVIGRSKPALPNQRLEPKALQRSEKRHR